MAFHRALQFGQQSAVVPLVGSGPGDSDISGLKLATVLVLQFSLECTLPDDRTTSNISASRISGDHYPWARNLVDSRSRPRDDCQVEQKDSDV